MYTTRSSYMHCSAYCARSRWSRATTYIHTFSQQLVEVTDLNVLRLKTSDSMATVVAKLFPPPLRWRQVWNTIGKRIDKHLYVWAAIPPSSDFAHSSARAPICCIARNDN